MSYAFVRLVVFLVTLLHTIFCNHAEKYSYGPDIAVALEADWCIPPEHAQIAAFLYKVDPKIAWSWIDFVHSNNDSMLKNDIDSLLLLFTPSLISNSTRDLLHASIASNQYTLQILASCSLVNHNHHAFIFLACNNRIIPVSDITDIESVISSYISSNQCNSLNITHIPSEIVFSYNIVDNNLPLILLLGDFIDKDTYQFHSILKEYCEKNLISYGFVQYLSSQCPPSTSRLKGYGIELSYKNTEYSAINNQDLNIPVSKNAMVSDEVDTEWTRVLSFLSSLVNTSSTSNEADESASSLGWKACHFILNLFNISSPLSSLRAITQNLPMFTTLLSKLDLPSEMKKKFSQTGEHVANMFSSHVSDLLFINGFYVDVKSTSIFRVLDWMTMYSKHYQYLSMNTSLDYSTVTKLLSPGYGGLLNSTTSPTLFDIRCDDSVIYLNDLENDQKYKSWNRTLSSLISFFTEDSGHLPLIARNFLTLCIVVNPSHSGHLQVLLGLIPSLAVRLLGVRISFILTDNGQTNRIAPIITSAIKYLLKEHSNPQYALLCLNNILEHSDNGIDAQSITRILKSMGVPSSILENGIMDSFGNRFESKIELPCMFLNGQRIEISQTMLIHLLRAAYSQLEWFKGEILSGRITDDQSNLDLYDYYLTNHRATKRFIPLIHQDSQTSVNIDYLPIELWKEPNMIENLTQYSVNLSSPNPHLYLWFVIDLVPQSTSLEYLISFLDSLRPNDPIPHVYLIPRFIYMDCNISNSITVKSLEEIYNMKGYIPSRVEKRTISFLKEISVNDVVLILNGRIIKSKQNIYNDLDPKQRDIIMLLQHELDTRIPVSSSWMTFHIVNAFHHICTENFKGQVLSARRLQPDSDPFTWLATRPFTEGLNINMEFAPQPMFQFNTVIDPLSEVSPKLVSWISFFSHYMNQSCNINILLYSMIGREKLPPPRFYRFVLHDSKDFGHFHNLPVSCPLLTMSLDVPSSWVIRPKYSPYDLDNIRLEHIPAQHLTILYKLTHVLLEGSCNNIRDDSTPRGLQLSLSPFSLTDTEHQEQDNTLVMANLGYYQLKTEWPGVYTISLRKGKSEDMFHFVVNGDIKGHNISLHRMTRSVLSSYDEKIGTLLGVYPNRGYEDKPILEGDVLHESTYKSGGGSSRLTALFESVFGKKEVKKNKGTSAEINIFSVASGHLYERFLRIMTMSVMNHTKSTVKFWFIANFLSPTFIDTLPYYASIVGFQYELVTYKWPSWLRSQTEKQRMIWGYKILFLDVLFPLDLDKIIFVDADQIVRTDLKELMNLDLNGAPYGFTPFCNSRKETENFRFWKSGYWKKHLSGRPYHISALFVVDLERFRQLAAGDLIREHYQILSADKDSLSNLDQDLPNDLQHIIPIFSLPMEWLWCETWCDDNSLSRAKTIDLCNNPLTKEPKLDRAKRILPEWTVYDNNVTAIMNMVQSYLNKSSNNDLDLWKQWYASRINRVDSEHEDL